MIPMTLDEAEKIVDSIEQYLPVMVRMGGASISDSAFLPSTIAFVMLALSFNGGEGPPSQASKDLKATLETLHAAAKKRHEARPRRDEWQREMEAVVERSLAARLV